VDDEPDTPDGPAKIVKVSSSTTSPLDQGVAGMFDGSTSTKMYTDAAFVNGASQAPNGGLNIDVEYSKPITVTSFRISTANDSDGRDPRQWTVSGSNDGITWDPPFYTANPAAGSSLLPTTRQAHTIFPRATDAPFEVTYKFFRLNVTSVRTAGNGFQISEFNLITKDGDMPLLAAAGKPRQALYIAEMANPITLAGDRKKISEPTLSWEQGTLTNNAAVAVNEGPAFTVRDDGIYLFYSANAGTHVNSSIGLLKASAGSDPLAAASWTKASEPVFKGGNSTTINNTAGVFYVRQPCLVKSPDGSEDWLLYQAGARSYGNAAGNTTTATQIRQYLNSMKDRSVRMQKIVWDAGGNPSFAVATTGTTALAGNAALTTQTFSQPSGTLNYDIYVVEAEDAELTGVMNPNNRTTTSELQKVTGIVNSWQRGGNENGGSQGSASGGWGTYWNASGGLAVRLGYAGAAKFKIDVDKKGTYNLTVMGVALEYNATQILDINGVKYDMVHTLYSQRYGGLFTPQTIAVELQEGVNVITITNKESNLGAVIDYLYIDYLGEKNISASDSIDVYGWAWHSSDSGEPMFNAELTLIPAVDMKVNVIVAEYNSRGALVYSDIRAIELRAGVPVNETVGIPAKAGNTYKVFIWDASSYVPLTSVVR
jgi:hypothetical protein